MSKHELLHSTFPTQNLDKFECGPYEENSYEDTKHDVTENHRGDAPGPKFVVWKDDTYLLDSLVDESELLDDLGGLFVEGLIGGSLFVALGVLSEERHELAFFVLNGLNLKKLDFVPLDDCWVAQGSFASPKVGTSLLPRY